MAVVFDRPKVASVRPLSQGWICVEGRAFDFQSRELKTTIVGKLYGCGNLTLQQIQSINRRSKLRLLNHAGSTFAVETSISIDRPRKSSNTRIRSLAGKTWVITTSRPRKGPSMIWTGWPTWSEESMVTTSSAPAYD